jgi:hypothetical protein
MAISLSQLNIEAQSETPFEFEITDEASGKGTGVFLSVLGAHSKTVSSFVTKTLNAKRRAEALQAAKGKRKDIDFTPVEDDIDFSVELAAIRITAWRGIEETFTPENAQLLCRTNPIIKQQVIEASEDIKNFTKG